VSIRIVSWSRLLVEGAAVVLSILLAFWIDAAWEQRQEQEADLTRLRALHSELQAHKVLLAEATSAHRATVEYGYELIGLLTPEPTADEAARITELLNGLLSYYRINAPFGSLQTATASGAIARMQNVKLASALASWPTVIEDLVEEQISGGTILVLDFYANLGRIVSLSDMYEQRFLNPTGRGTEEIISAVAFDKLPETFPLPDYSLLHNNIIFGNDLMGLMMMAQSSHGEAVIADQKLSELMQQLQACLAERDC